MMKILAIETSATACSLALLIDDQIISRHVHAPMQQTQLILPMISELLTSSQVSLKQLNALAFGCGPGSFTGIRIATSVAQGLGYSTSLPLIPISSLAALAQSTQDELGWKKLLVAVDARMGEIYWGVYEANKHGIVQLKDLERLCRFNNVVFPTSSGWYGVGNGWGMEGASAIFTPLAIDAERQPTASGVARLAKIQYENKRWVTADKVEPVYLREKVTT